jgi:DNA-binding NarL/FixJ family response regulator
LVSRPLDADDLEQAVTTAYLAGQVAEAMELAAARTVLAGLGAGPDLERLDRLAGAAPAAGGLTGRELEVLRLVAAEIAAPKPAKVAASM